MLTKQQKIQQVEQGQKLLKESKSLIFVDFSGKGVDDLSALRKTLKEIGAKFKVIKKRLMRVVFEKEGIDFNPEQFELQMGTVFAPKEIFEIASTVYKSNIQILGGYDLAGKNFMDAEKVKFIGKLPSREILLGQLVGMIATPMKMFLSVLKQKSEQTVENKS
ncbi:MAG: 50S ribosomal protein L10 [Patescibacteria group bacterium]